MRGHRSWPAHLELHTVEYLAPRIRHQLQRMLARNGHPGQRAICLAQTFAIQHPRGIGRARRSNTRCMDGGMSGSSARMAPAPG